MADEKVQSCAKELIYSAITAFLFVSFFVCILLVSRDSSPPSSKAPMFAVESTSVKSYNLTTIISLGIRARNPNLNNSCTFFGFHEMAVQVSEGRRDDVVAQGSVMDFGLCANNETLIHVEAVGVDDGGVVGVGRVNVSLTGRVGVFGSFLDVMCMDVGVNVSRSTSWYQNVDCNVTLKIPLPTKDQEYAPWGDDEDEVDYCLLYRRPS